jgi:serine/threonine-protein kinase
MAPEQLAGRPVERTADVFALGILLYELLTLRHPFGAKPFDDWVIEPGARLIPPRARAPKRNVPLELERACLKALEEDPAARHPTARHLHDEVQEWLEAASDRAKRQARAGRLAARAEELLQSHFASRASARDLEEAVARLRQRFKSWQTVPEKAPLFEAEDRLAEARRTLVETASEVVMTLSAALGQDEDHPVARRLMADYYWDRFVEAESQQNLDSRDYFGRLVAAFHEGKYDRELQGDGSLRLSSVPAGAEVRLYRYRERDLQLVAEESRVLGQTPFDAAPLPMGSYLAIVSKEGYADVRYPVFISRNREWSDEVRLCTDQEIGPGFRYVPAGPFIQGGDAEVRGWCLPRSEPVLEDFFIAEYPVTLGEYLDYLRQLAEKDPEEARRRSPRRGPDGGSYFSYDRGIPREPPEELVRELGWSAHTPVVAVSWLDAVAYCEWRSQQEGVEVRLPTESEWEKASRGVDGRWFPWGYRFDPSLCNMGGSLKGRRAPQPVDSFPSDVSVYGVRGTAGNAREWTGTVLIDAEGEEGETRVVRGGAWNLPAVICRSANRFWLAPNFPVNYVGFRLARSGRLELQRDAKGPKKSPSGNLRRRGLSR